MVRMHIKKAKRNSTRRQISPKMQEKEQIVALPISPYQKIVQKHSYTKKNSLDILPFLTRSTMNATRKVCKLININKSKKSC